MLGCAFAILGFCAKEEYESGPCQTHVTPGLTVKVSVDPWQIGVVPPTVSTRAGFTVIVAVAKEEQLLASVPTTVYTVVEAGVKVTDGVVASVLHVYVLAPPAVKVALNVGQTVADVAVTTGKVLTVTVAVVVLVQVFTSVPVIVYTVVEGGFPVTLVPDEAFNPGDQE